MAQPTQEQFATKGDDIGPNGAVDTTHVQPKGTSDVSSGNEQLGVRVVDTDAHGTEGVNPVLEHEAQSKGRWFQYVKTKQFWLVMILGQGESSLNL